MTMEREEAIWWVNHLFEIRKEEYFNKGMMKDAKEVEEAQNVAIEALSADAVSVVRCKDCRHRDLFSCPLADNDFQKDEDFCSWGERREE